MSKPSYNIYPSLLDKFQRLLDTEADFESSFNEGEDGYKQSFEEMYAANEQSLLDSVNRVEHEPIEAADKGTCFNEIVDAIKDRRGSSREDVVIERYEDPTWGMCIKAKMNDFEFLFDTGFCKGAARYFAGAVSQVRCEAILPTKYGDVLLYGYIDELRGQTVYDIKTTKSYDSAEKYANGWQRRAYPYCLTASGDAQVKDFEYTCYQLQGGGVRTPLISGEQYRERYPYNHTQATAELQAICEAFIEWLEEHREQITDKKIFNQLNEE